MGAAARSRPASSCRRSDTAASRPASWRSFCLSQSARCTPTATELAVTEPAPRTELLPLCVVSSSWGSTPAALLLRLSSSCRTTSVSITFCASNSRRRSIRAACLWFRSLSTSISSLSWLDSMSARSFAVVLLNSWPKDVSSSFTCLSEASDHQSRSASSSRSLRRASASRSSAVPDPDQFVASEPASAILGCWGLAPKLNMWLCKGLPPLPPPEGVCPLGGLRLLEVPSAAPEETLVLGSPGVAA
mmetsp:Transcript_32308/g.93044  ORF Transcript_32308/g.93044 Transcript_32308/m.93044 type:complete len:246 (-) Transcript_32308:93-830(-)